MKEQSIQSKITEISILLILSVIFVLFSCESSSPVTDRDTNDSAIFIAMGKMFVEGKVPYLEFFDHKGPSLVLLEAIPQLLLKDRMAIFLLEIVNLFISLLIISKIAKLLHFSTLKKVTLWSLFLLFISRLISKGNSVEELSFVPLLISLYYLCKYYFIEKKIYKRDAFIIGLCFSFIFWLRANNAGFIVGICIFMFLTTIIDKNYKSLKNLILYFIIGQLPFTVIYLAYFLYYGAVYELIYATFLFNMNYVSKLISPSMHSLWVNLLVFLLLLISSILYYKRIEKDYKVFILVSLIYITSAAVINMGYGFTYYYLLYGPTFVFGCVLLMKSIDDGWIIKSIFALSSFLFVLFTAHKGYYLVTEGEGYKEKVRTEKEKIYKLLDKIPDNERDKIFYYDQFPTIFYLDGVTSNYKYCFIQEWHGKHDKKIFEEINETMQQNTPHYVFINQFEGDTIDEKKYYNQEFWIFLKNNYHILTQDDKKVVMKWNNLK